MFSLWPAGQLSWCRNKPKSLRTVEKMVSSNSSWEKTSSNQGCNRIWRLDSLRPSPQSTHMFFEHRPYEASFLLYDSQVQSSLRLKMFFSWTSSLACFYLGTDGVFSGQTAVSPGSTKVQNQNRRRQTRHKRMWKQKQQELKKFTSERIDTSRLDWSWPEWLAVRRV